jgi:hypothetical protein
LVLSLLRAVYNPDVRCPTNWVYMYDGCYKKQSTEATWIGASIAAVRNHGALATIHSSEHNRWLTEHLRRMDWMNSHMWIGYNDIAEEGTWTTTDGSDADYFNWGLAQPDGGDTANCIHFDTSAVVFDEPCQGKKAALFRYADTPRYVPESKFTRCAFCL